MHILWILLGIVVCAMLLQQLNVQKEGFEVEPEERISPEVFSYNLLQAVKGPISRLSSQLLDMRNWRERIELATLTPVELARRAIARPQ